MPPALIVPNEEERPACCPLGHDLEWVTDCVAYCEICDFPFSLYSWEENEPIGDDIKRGDKILLCPPHAEIVLVLIKMEKEEWRREGNETGMLFDGA